MSIDWDVLHGNDEIEALFSYHNVALSTIDGIQTFPRIISSNGIEVNYNAQNISDKQLSIFLKLVKDIDVKNHLREMYLGEKVNLSEDKPALHTALRSLPNKSLIVDGIDIMQSVNESLDKMYKYTKDLRNDKSNPNTGKVITDIVNVGMGGSDLGARMALKALSADACSGFSFHFLSDIDPDEFSTTVEKLNPESTLFIICSKSFNTRETISNMMKILDWSNDDDYIKNNIIAVTANTMLARSYGIETCFSIWSWVGGRYSFFSAMNLLLMIAVGYEKFQEMLKGAREMDAHVLNEPYHKNLAVMLALIDIININGRGASSRVLLIYGSPLSKIVPYIQQLEMESNGKSKSEKGEPLDYATSSIVWGGMGNQAQHAYYQLLYEGSHITPSDLFTIKLKKYDELNRYAKELMKIIGDSNKQHYLESSAVQKLIPVTHISIDNISPYILGALVALFEHKVFVESVIWGINPFDQPGVERVKRHISQI